MSYRHSGRVSARLLRGVLALAMAATAATGTQAQLIDNTAYVTYAPAASPAMPAILPVAITTTPTSTAPAGFWEELATPATTATYHRDTTTPGGPYLVVTVSNSSTTDNGNYALHANPLRALAVGNVARSKISLIVSQADPQVYIAGSMYQYAGTTYNGQLESETSVADGSRTTLQTVTAELVGGTKSVDTNLSTTQARPILAVYNIPRSGSVVLRVKSWTLDNGTTTGNGIFPLSVLGRQQNTGPSKNFKVSVDLIGKTLTGSYVSTLEVVNNLGFIKKVVSHSSSEWSAQNGRIVDNFTLDMSGISMPAGDYTLRYKIATTAGGPGIQLGATSTGVTEVNFWSASPADWRYRIGDVTVSANGGLHLGMSYHYYPPSGTRDSEASFGAPYAHVDFKFARTLANDKLWKPWWNVNPDGSLNTTDPNRWTDLDAWANKFASAGQRKLLITFFGSPTAASSSPTLISGGWGLAAPGISAPPVNLTVFRQAVEATVSRLSGRIFAVECWNEPNSYDMFSGTKTQLADICQKVYEGTKAIDPTIPVICPQADSPYTAGWVYSAKTTAGNPITNYCDWVGAHIYSRLSNDVHSKPYAVQSLNTALRLLKVRSQQYGISAKKLAVTEFGINRCTWSTTPAYGRVGPTQTLDDLSNADKADAMLQAAMTMHEEGVTALGLYSYDEEVDPSTVCRRGGSYVWAMDLTVGGAQIVNTSVMGAFNSVRTQVGTTTNATP